LLREGLAGLHSKVRERRQGESAADKLAFLTAAEHALAGLAAWSQRYGEFLAAEAARCGQAGRAAELREMSRICTKVAAQPPETFREALQLVWLAHQAIHIEGHGYSCTPDRLDQLLLPLYEADVKAGRIDDATVVRLAENLARSSELLGYYQLPLRGTQSPPKNDGADVHTRPSILNLTTLNLTTHSSTNSGIYEHAILHHASRAALPAH